MKPTPKHFFKSEHWSLQLLYLIGYVCLLFQVYFIFGNDPSIHTVVPVIGYSIVALFLFRWKNVSRKTQHPK
jgi:hypothetical protein